jgi:quinol monooxygenase YgiN
MTTQALKSNFDGTNSMVQALLRLKVIPENQDKAVEIINFILERIRVESGCASCHFYQDTSSKGEFLLLQEWESRADLERHICSEEFRHILALIELASEPPEIRFNTISKEEGIETIESVRGSN